MQFVMLKTFGCKVNQADTEAICGALSGADIRTAPYSAAAWDAGGWAALINTCCVTAEAERKALQFVRKLRRAQPAAPILLTGCGARNESSVAAYAAAGATVVPWHADAMAWLREHAPVTSSAEPATMQPPDAPASRARAFLKVQDGCCNYCAYCIVPFVRAFSSKPEAQVLEETDLLVAAGKHELVLTGVNVGHYGMAPVWQAGYGPPEPAEYQAVAGQAQLSELVQAILERLPDGCRLRLSSLEPDTLTPHLLELFSHPRLCQHLHMPLQSGSDAVLSAMRRRYTSRQFLDLVDSFRKLYPYGAVTTDILVGFPTETDADFAETLALCSAAKFERVHGFPYSRRPGTAAAELMPLPPGLVQQRNRELIAAGNAIAAVSWQRFVGRQSEILVEELQTASESRSAVTLKGHGEAYQIVQLTAVDNSETARSYLGQILPASLESYSAGQFKGRLN